MWGKTELPGTRARVGGTATIAPLLGPPMGQSTNGIRCACGESCPAQPIMEMHWSVRLACLPLCLSGILPQPTQVGHCQTTSPTLWLPQATHLLAGSSFQLTQPMTDHTFQRRFLVSNHWCQPELQYLLSKS